MISIGNILRSIAQMIAGKKPLENQIETMSQEKFAFRYADITDVNITAMVANKLATITIGDSALSVVGDGKKADITRKQLDNIWSKLKNITSTAYGVGGAAIIPTTYGESIGFNAVPGNQFFITEMQASEITQAVLLCEEYRDDHHIYRRWALHSYANGVWTIDNRVTIDDGKAVPITYCPQWASIPPIVNVSGVDRLPIAYIRCPADNRRPERPEGVPITFGCEKVINQILTCLKQFEDEFDLGEIFVSADPTLLDKDGNLPKRRLFRRTSMPGGKLGTDGKMDVFAPQLRAESYLLRLNALYELLENQIGTGRGILTKPETYGATATEIKSALIGTKMITDLMRSQIDRAIDTIVYAIDVIASATGVSGEVPDVSINWDYSLYESSTETFAQLIQAKAVGAVDAVDIRQYVMPNESREEAEQAVKTIKESNPTTEELFGV